MVLIYIDIMKFKANIERAYNPAFVEKIKRGKLHHIQGKDKVIKTRDLWK
jgi:hypothetical protein